MVQTLALWNNYSLTILFSLMVGAILMYISRYYFQRVELNIGFLHYANVPLLYAIAGLMLIGLVFTFALYALRGGLGLLHKRFEGNG